MIKNKIRKNEEKKIILEINMLLFIILPLVTFRIVKDQSCIYNELKTLLLHCR